MSESSVGSNPTLSAEVTENWSWCTAAFVERPEAAWRPLLERSDRVGTDLGEIAEGVIELDR